MAREAFFLPASPGQRFCLFHKPDDPARERGALIFIHPFAEEMNKCRRQVAMQARSLAAAGFSVLEIDLLGCGDSSGDFGDATWDAWVEDVRLACAWVRRRTAAPLWLWGLRAGCLIAADAARKMDEPVGFLFWQPTISGKLFLQQFLRLKMAGALLDGDAKGITPSMRQQLAAGKTVEVAGYFLSAALAAGLERAHLAPPAGGGRLVWLEMSNHADATLAPVSQKCLQSWAEAGYQTRGRMVGGQQFWQTVDIAECPALVDATLEMLGEHVCS